MSTDTKFMIQRPTCCDNFTAFIPFVLDKLPVLIQMRDYDSELRTWLIAILLISIFIVVIYWYNKYGRLIFENTNNSKGNNCQVVIYCNYPNNKEGLDNIILDIKDGTCINKVSSVRFNELSTHDSNDRNSYVNKKSSMKVGEPKSQLRESYSAELRSEQNKNVIYRKYDDVKYQNGSEIILDAARLCQNSPRTGHNNIYESIELKEIKSPQVSSVSTFLANIASGSTIDNQSRDLKSDSNTWSNIESQITRSNRNNVTFDSGSIWTTATANRDKCIACLPKENVDGSVMNNANNASINLNRDQISETNTSIINYGLQSDKFERNTNANQYKFLDFTPSIDKIYTNNNTIQPNSVNIQSFDLDPSRNESIEIVRSKSGPAETSEITSLYPAQDLNAIKSNNSIPDNENQAKPYEPQTYPESNPFAENNQKYVVKDLYESDLRKDDEINDLVTEKAGKLYQSNSYTGSVSSINKRIIPTILTEPPTSTSHSSLSSKKNENMGPDSADEHSNNDFFNPKSDAQKYASLILTQNNYLKTSGKNHEDTESSHDSNMGSKYDSTHDLAKSSSISSKSLNANDSESISEHSSQHNEPVFRIDTSVNPSAFKKTSWDSHTSIDKPNDSQNIEKYEKYEGASIKSIISSTSILSTSSTSTQSSTSSMITTNNQSVSATLDDTSYTKVASKENKVQSKVIEYETRSSIVNKVNELASAKSLKNIPKKAVFGQSQKSNDTSSSSSSLSSKKQNDSNSSSSTTFDQDLNDQNEKKNLDTIAANLNQPNISNPAENLIINDEDFKKNRINLLNALNHKINLNAPDNMSENISDVSISYNSNPFDESMNSFDELVRLNKAKKDEMSIDSIENASKNDALSTESSKKDDQTLSSSLSLNAEVRNALNSDEINRKFNIHLKSRNIEIENNQIKEEKKTQNMISNQIKIFDLKSSAKPFVLSASSKADKQKVNETKSEKKETEVKNRSNTITKPAHNAIIVMERTSDNYIVSKIHRDEI